MAPAVEQEPRITRVPSICGRGVALVSQVPCLGDTLGVVGIKKNSCLTVVLLHKRGVSQLIYYQHFGELSYWEIVVAPSFLSFHKIGSSQRFFRRSSSPCSQECNKSFCHHLCLRFIDWLTSEKKKTTLILVPWILSRLGLSLISLVSSELGEKVGALLKPDSWEGGNIS